MCDYNCKNFILLSMIQSLFLINYNANNKIIKVINAKDWNKILTVLKRIHLIQTEMLNKQMPI